MGSVLFSRSIIVSEGKLPFNLEQHNLSLRQNQKYKTTTDSNHNNRIEPNKLNRKFNVDEANRYWTTDITYIATHQGFIYLAVVMDLYSRRIVGWSIANNMRTEL